MRKREWGRGGAGVITAMVGIPLLSALCAACTATPAPPPPPLIQHGYYSVAENTKALQDCQQHNQCDVALFNLGLAYVSSPVRNLPKAFQCFDKISREYPTSPWVYQARAWMRILSEQRTLEAQQRKLEADLRTSDETVRDLRGRLDRSRNIDIEMEKKERELLR